MVKKLIERLAREFPIVWDRYTEDNNYYVIYGWIPRKDKQRDFVIITLEEGDPSSVWYTTSSAKYSKQICDFLYGESDQHNECKKIEDLYENNLLYN